MKKLLLLILPIFIISCSFSQEKVSKELFVGFWNLENLFDTYDDPLKNDDEFLPEGRKQWNSERLERKLYNLSRVIRSMNNDDCPDILGVCEVENQALLDTLVKKFFADIPFRTLSPESPDQRSIQTGIIYNSEKLKLLETYKDSVFIDQPTRLILGASFLLDGEDTLYVFVNHWPSRRGGEAESESKRIAAAKVLRKRIDGILSFNKFAKIIIMGDFNDEPTNTSILNYLKAKPLLCDSINDSEIINSIDNQSIIFNLAYELYSKGDGSYKHQDDWNMLDQIIVSKELLTGSKVRYLCGSFEVYKPKFMITRSGKYQGTPFPTYGGNRYLGGYSDHFPVIAKFIIEEK